MLHKYIVNTAGIIYNELNQFLLIKRSDTDKQVPGIYAYPAGKADAEVYTDNILEKNLKREVKEETGVNIEKIEYLHSELFQRTSGEWVVIIHFLAKYKNGVLKAEDTNEISEVKWMNLKEIQTVNTLPIVKTIYKLAYQKILKK